MYKKIFHFSMVLAMATTLCHQLHGMKKLSQDENGPYSSKDEQIIGVGDQTSASHISPDGVNTNFSPITVSIFDYARHQEVLAAIRMIIIHNFIKPLLSHISTLRGLPDNLKKQAQELAYVERPGHNYPADLRYIYNQLIDQGKTLDASYRWGSLLLLNLDCINEINQHLAFFDQCQQNKQNEREKLLTYITQVKKVSHLSKIVSTISNWTPEQKALKASLSSDYQNAKAMNPTSDYSIILNNLLMQNRIASLLESYAGSLDELNRAIKWWEVFLRDASLKLHSDDDYTMLPSPAAESRNPACTAAIGLPKERPSKSVSAMSFKPTLAVLIKILAFYLAEQETVRTIPELAEQLRAIPNDWSLPEYSALQKALLLASTALYKYGAIVNLLETALELAIESNTIVEKYTNASASKKINLLIALNRIIDKERADSLTMSLELQTNSLNHYINSDSSTHPWIKDYLKPAIDNLTKNLKQYKATIDRRIKELKVVSHPAFNLPFQVQQENYENLNYDYLNLDNNYPESLTF